MTPRPDPLTVLREQIAAARSVSATQPGPVTLSCFHAEQLLAIVEAARTYAALVPVVGAKGSIPARERLLDALAPFEEEM